jgi:hypothetical protein
MPVVVKPDLFKVSPDAVENLRAVAAVPAALEDYWLRHGHGFFIEDVDGNLISDDVANRLIDPNEVLDLLQNAADLAPEFKHGIPFFEMNDRRFLLIAPDGRIVSAEVGVEVVSQSFEEFIDRIVREPFFYDGEVDGDDEED